MEYLHFNPAEGGGGDNQVAEQPLSPENIQRYREWLIGRIKEEGLTIQGKEEGKAFSDVDGNLATFMWVRALMAGGYIEKPSDLRLNFVRPQDLNEEHPAYQAGVFVDVGNAGYQTDIEWGQTETGEPAARPVRMRVDHHEQSAPTLNSSATERTYQLLKSLDMWPKETNPEIDWDQIVAFTKVMDNKAYPDDFYIEPSNSFGMLHARVEVERRQGNKTVMRSEPLSGVNPATREMKPEFLYLMSATGGDPMVKIADEQLAIWGLTKAVTETREKLEQARAEFNEVVAGHWVVGKGEQRTLVDLDDTVANRLKGVDFVDLLRENKVYNLVRYWTPEKNQTGHRGVFVSSLKSGLDLKKLDEAYRLPDRPEESGLLVRESMYIYNRPSLAAPKLEGIAEALGLNIRQLAPELREQILRERNEHQDAIKNLYEERKQAKQVGTSTTELPMWTNEKERASITPRQIRNIQAKFDAALNKQRDYHLDHLHCLVSHRDQAIQQGRLSRAEAWNKYEKAGHALVQQTKRSLLAEDMLESHLNETHGNEEEKQKSYALYQEHLKLDYELSPEHLREDVFGELDYCITMSETCERLTREVTDGHARKHLEDMFPTIDKWTEELKKLLTEYDDPKAYDRFMEAREKVRETMYKYIETAERTKTA